jgi:hypothetical protein
VAGTQLHVTEHAVGNKLVRQAYVTKTAALANARARVLDADVATVAVWLYQSELDARGALMESVAGREWYESRTLTCVVAKKAVRVTK